VECGGLTPLFLRLQFLLWRKSLGKRIHGRRRKSGSWAAALQKTKRPDRRSRPCRDRSRGAPAFSV